MFPYEIHVTIASSVDTNPTKFSDYCRKHDGKALLIELDRGNFPLQLMLAKHTKLQRDFEAITWGLNVADLMRDDGWEVCRTKVETTLTPGDAEYFEAHYKLETEQWEASQFPGFLQSLNRFDDRVHYLSRRHHGTFLEALDFFEDGKKLILASGYPLVKTHYERVIVDTNPEVDAGWTTI